MKRKLPLPNGNASPMPKLSPISHSPAPELDPLSLIALF